MNIKKQTKNKQCPKTNVHKNIHVTLLSGSRVYKFLEFSAFKLVFFSTSLLSNQTQDIATVGHMTNIIDILAKEK